MALGPCYWSATYPIIDKGHRLPRNGAYSGPLRSLISVTLRLLWEEYKYLHPSGYQYSQFCEHYSRFKQKLNRSLRQTHKAGEKLFVDYAGESGKIYN